MTPPGYTTPVDPRIDATDGSDRGSDTVYDVACSLHAGRWYATVAEPEPPPDGQLLSTDVADVDDLPFAITDLLAARRGVRAQRLRLLGPDLPALFTGSRTGRRLRSGATAQCSESWTGLLADDTVAVTVHSLRAP